MGAGSINPFNMLEQELQKIYDSEINIHISWLWDGGIDLKLGDEMNGYDAEGQIRTVAEIVPWLQKAISKHYPRSQYNLDRLKNMPDKVVEFPSISS
jgi:hypothetical protein